MELSKEMDQRMEEASKDDVWVKKLRTAGTWEEYVKLLAEKGIEAPPELKEAFIGGCQDKVGKLEDDELENVSGGWTNIFNCPQEYNNLLCRLTFCPNKDVWDNTPDDDHYTYYCRLFHWTHSLPY